MHGKVLLLTFSASEETPEKLHAWPRMSRLLGHHPTAWGRCRSSGFFMDPVNLSTVTTLRNCVGDFVISTLPVIMLT